jgi:hypothetical protein
MKTLLQTKRKSTFPVFILLLSFIFFVPAQQAQTLVGHWQMDEGSGTTLVDVSASANDGTITGSPSWVTGVINQALSLNGSTYALVPYAASLDITSAITLSVWIKPNTLTTSYVIKKAISSVDGYELSISSSGVPFFRLNNYSSGNTYRVDANNPLVLNGWTHIAGTYDGTNMHIYVNGIQDDDAPTLGPTLIATNNEALGIGAQSNGASPVNGTIDDARIYNGALDATAVLALFNVFPTVPVLNSPANGLLNVTIPPTLSWYASGGAETYQLQVSTISDFSSTVFDQSGITTTSTSVTGLSNASFYYWRVRATNSTMGTSNWSTVWNFTTTLPAAVNAGTGFALNFNGTDNYVSVPDANSLDLTTGATFEVWIKPNAIATQRILYKYSTSTGYELFLASNQKFSFRINGSDATRVNSTTSYPVDGTWGHVAATYDGVNMKLFINGIQEGGNIASSNIVANAVNLGIGADPSPADYFQGQMDEVRVWNVARTVGEIQANMCKKLTGLESGLVGYWRFNETSGSVATDATANANNGLINGTLINAHLWSGAAIGDASAFDYTGSVVGDFVASLGTGSEIFTATGSGIGTVTGIQVYRVDDNSLRPGSSVPSGWTVDPLRYWGAKVFGTGAAYDLVYDYTGHPDLGTEADLKIAKRNNLSDVNWIDAIAVLDEGANTLTLTGQTGTEFSLASSSAAPLPVELNMFSAITVGEKIQLDWKTETEVNNYGFEILRQAQDDKQWNNIGFVNGNGNSNSPKSYSFEDKNVTTGKYSYRLKQIDNDGQFEYSKIVEVNFGDPGKFELSQNYPNPFNPETIIKFSIAQAGNVKLTVYNILGEQISQLINEFREAGIHTINFDASQFNSGLYLYKLESNGLVQTKKMLLVK